MDPPFFTNPSIFIHFLIKKCQRGIGIDRSWHCGHFGLCIFWETSILFLKTCWDVVFLNCLRMFCQNSTKTKMTALARSMDLKSGWTHVHGKIHKNQTSQQVWVKQIDVSQKMQRPK